MKLYDNMQVTHTTGHVGKGKYLNFRAGVCRRFLSKERSAGVLIHRGLQMWSIRWNSRLESPAALFLASILYCLHAETALTREVMSDCVCLPYVCLLAPNSFSINCIIPFYF